MIRHALTGCAGMPTLGVTPGAGPGCGVACPGGGAMAESTRSKPSLGAPFRFAEFRVLWGAEVVSVAGDQLARVALAVLVHGRTGSALWAAATYALTFLPALLGGLLLGGLADRYPRRRVMVACDAVRAVLAGLMALPGLPLWAVAALLVVVVLLAPPHTAAQGALLPEVLPGRAFEAGLALRQITNQTAQVAGFAAGGLAVAVIGPSLALAVNAATFALSAVVLRAGVAARPAPDAPGPDAARRGRWRADTRAGIVAVFTEPRRRAHVLAAWLMACLVVPEALAAPYAVALGEGPLAVGVLMAADPAGSVVGAWLVARYLPDRLRDRAIGPLAVAAGLPLAACVFGPGLVGSVLLWALAGGCATACLVQAQAGFVRATPDALRGRAIGVAAAGLIAVQGAAVLLGGLAAEFAGAVAAVAACGLLGALAALPLWRAHHRLARAGTVARTAAGAVVAS